MLHQKSRKRVFDDMSSLFEIYVTIPQSTYCRKFEVTVDYGIDTLKMEKIINGLFNF